MPIKNIEFQAGGVTVLATGIWTMVDKSFINELLRNDLYMTPAYVLVVSGLLITLLSLFGCFGAIKKVNVFFSLILHLLSAHLWCYSSRAFSDMSSENRSVCEIRTANSFI